MKLTRISLALILLMTSTLSWGETTRRDGNWWLAGNKPSNLSYVVGFYDGMDLGNRFSCRKYNIDTKKGSDCVDLAGVSYQEYVKKYFRNVTNNQLAERLDSFYADYKNRRILVINAVWLVVNGIAGTPKEELNKMIEYWRKSAGH